jgi:peptidoglycan/LPS O-acetylase OafA/YrhL
MAVAQHQSRPLTVIVVALIQSLQAAVVLAVAVLAGVEAGQGKSYQQSSGIALAVIGIGTGVALAFVAAGLARARRWSRTPALLTQLFSGIVAIYLVQGHRYWWGIPLLTCSAAGLVLLFLPPSVRALTLQPQEPPAPG